MVKMSEEVKATAVAPNDESTEKLSAVIDEEILSDLEGKIIKQVEFYYGDINLARDKFLLEQIKLDDGWVPLEIMVKFNRLKTLCSDEAAIAKALRKSKSGLIEVNSEGTKIRRCVSKPIPEVSKERQDELKYRFVYAKGFPLDADLDSLMAFFEKFGSTEWVQMRRNRQREFKGSCFIIFKSNETAKKFLETSDVKYGDVPLLREYKHEHFQRKIEERKQIATEKAKQKSQTEEADATKSISDVLNRMVKGAILSVDKIPDECTIENIRSAFSSFGDVKWVDINKSDAQARIRFAEADGAKLALEKANETVGGVIKVNDVDVTCSVLEGDEEIQHWHNIFNRNKDRPKHMGGGRGHKRRFGGRRQDTFQRKKRKFDEKTEDDDNDDDNDNFDNGGNSD